MLIPITATYDITGDKPVLISKTMAEVPDEEVAKLFFQAFIRGNKLETNKHVDE